MHINIWGLGWEIRFHLVGVISDLFFIWDIMYWFIICFKCIKQIFIYLCISASRLENYLRIVKFKLAGLNHHIRDNKSLQGKKCEWRCPKPRSSLAGREGAPPKWVDLPEHMSLQAPHSHSPYLAIYSLFPRGDFSALGILCELLFFYHEVCAFISHWWIRVNGRHGLLDTDLECSLLGGPVK